MLLSCRGAQLSFLIHTVLVPGPPTDNQICRCSGPFCGMLRGLLVMYARPPDTLNHPHIPPRISLTSHANCCVNGCSAVCMENNDKRKAEHVQYRWSLGDTFDPRLVECAHAAFEGKRPAMVLGISEKH